MPPSSYRIFSRALITLSLLAVLVSTSRALDYDTYGKDYSCYHQSAWQENKNLHYNHIFSSYTGVLTSEYSGASAASTNVVKHFKVAGGNGKDVWTRMLQSSSIFASFFGRGPSAEDLESVGQKTLRGVQPLAPSASATPHPTRVGTPHPTRVGTPRPTTTGSTGTIDSGDTSGYVTTGWKIVMSGIPKYDHTFTSTEIATLNSRPKKSTDFLSNSATTAEAGTFYNFGTNINYKSPSCALGYWPPGPVCPANYSGGWKFDLTPAPETHSGNCYGTMRVGLFVSGAGAWSWSDANSYNSENVWHNCAMEFEQYDMDVCAGHAAGGVYHHHSYSPCLATLLGDTGTGHSPIHGFAYDSFPIYGPYQAANTLAQSCWQKRDYSASSATGCSDGTRSCVLVDMFDYTQGVTTASKSGPNTTTTIQGQSSNPLSSASGIFYEDYFYNATCGALGGAYLNEFNGHDHDNLGFHYHTTVDSSMRPTFPYIVGPKYYGCIRGGTCSTAISAGATGGTTSSVSSSCGTSSAVALASQQCTSYSFQSNYTSLSSSDSSDSDSSNQSGLSMATIAIIAGVVGGVAVAALLVLVFWYCCQSASARGFDNVSPTAKVIVMTSDNVEMSSSPPTALAVPDYRGRF